MKNFMNVFKDGKKHVTNLPPQFFGRGAKEGYLYYRLQDNPVAYLYEVKNITTKEKHYEVFERWIDSFENRELYPFEEPVIDTLQSTNNNAAAMQRWIQMLREAQGLSYG